MLSIIALSELSIPNDSIKLHKLGRNLQQQSTPAVIENSWMTEKTQETSEYNTWIQNYTSWFPFSDQMSVEYYKISQ